MLTLKTAQRILASIFEKAETSESKPLAVVIANASGEAILLARQDGAGNKRTELCKAKVDSAVALNIPTRALSAFHGAQPELHSLLSATLGVSLIPLAGGVLIKDDKGLVLGAVGVSGGDLKDEEAFAIQAILDSGFYPDPREPYE
jgi:uncharacterized protein GlcG (DUF336 family)